MEIEVNKNNTFKQFDNEEPQPWNELKLLTQEKDLNDKSITIQNDLGDYFQYDREKGTN
jgi:hypothetical protein